MIFITYFGMNGFSQHVSFQEYSFPHEKSDDHKICFRQGHDIVIPQYHHFPCNISMNDKRPMISFFRGRIRADLVCSSGSRVILKYLSVSHQMNESVLSINQPKIRQIGNSYVAFCPSGVACWSSRLYHSLCSNTIPLIIAREVIQPFERFLNWKSFTLKLDSEDLLNDHFLEDLSRQFEYHPASSSDSSFSPTLPSSQSSYYIPSPMVQNYLDKVEKVRHWFSWNQSAPESAWKLLLLELYCRSKKVLDVSLCSQSSSKIANSTYFFDYPAYSRDNSLDLVSPIRNESNPHFQVLKNFIPPF